MAGRDDQAVAAGIVVSQYTVANSSADESAWPRYPNPCGATIRTARSRIRSANRAAAGTSMAVIRGQPSVALASPQ